MKQIGDGTYFHTTIGLTATHSASKQPKLVRVEMTAKDEKSDVTLVAVNGHNTAPIHKTGKVVISREEYENRPTDPYDDSVEALWAMSRLGWLTVSDGGSQEESYGC